MYTIKQTQTKKSLFGLISREVKKVYNFDTLNSALLFALNEQIDIITCNIGEGITTKRKPFKDYYSLKQFIKVSKKNPFFYLGVHNYKKVDIEKIYFYLVQNNLSKLRKFN